MLFKKLNLFKLDLFLKRSTCKSSSMLQASDHSTVDKREVEHHDKFAKDWWDPKGSMKGLHSMNCLRIPFIRNGLINTGKLSKEACQSAQSFKGLKLLDVGCGGGILSIPMARLGGDVTGIDPSTNLISVAQGKLNQENSQATSDTKLQAQFISTTIEEHAINNQNMYDAVVLSEVIEHVSNKEDFLKATVDTLKPGGSIFITTLNKTRLSWGLGIIVAENILNLLPKGTHEWNKFIEPCELQKLLEKVGCTTKLVNGMLYIPLQNMWYWCPVDAINYALHAVKNI